MAGVDVDRFGSLLLNHKVYLDVGHDEYWSGQQRTNVEAARDAGVNLSVLERQRGLLAHPLGQQPSAATRRPIAP